MLDAYLAGDFTIPANDSFGFERVDTGMTFHWKVPQEYVNSAGNLQGGVLAALAEMKISFLRPVRAGTTITGTGRVLKSGKRLLFVEAEITDADGTLLAKVTGTEIPAPA